MSRKRITTDQFHEELREVARVRLLTPGNKALARKGHCSEATVEFYIARYMRELRNSLVSCGTDAETIGHGRPTQPA